MKSSTSSCALILSLLIILSCSVACSSLHSNHIKSFLHCLTTKSHPSHPITTAIFTHKNASFSSIFQSYARNLRFISSETLQNPVAIVTAMHESHVQATVICCKAHDLMLRTRSGGHDMEGLSYVSELVPFVLLDMFNLRNMRIDLASETMWVQSGATLGEVYYNIAAKSKTHAFPAGLCPTVGVGGHFSGGGFGTLVRKYGLSVDNVIDARAVDVNGRILDRKEMGEDLFWAINGGGGASFAVLLSWKIKLVKVPETVTVFVVNRTLEQGGLDLVHRWQEVSSKLHEDIFVRLELRAVQKTIRATFVGMYLGTIQKLLPYMKKRFPKLGFQRSDCTEMSWIESVLYFYAFPKGTPKEVLLNRTQNDQSFVKSKSDFVKKPISKKGLKVIFKRMMELRDVLMQWNPYGGRMSEISETQTPLPHRAGYIFKIQYLVYWQEKGKDGHYLNLARQLFDAMTPFVSKCPRDAFLNYRDLEIGSSPYCNATYEEAKVYVVKYFGENFGRLAKVKTKVDPHNFFRDEQSIPTLTKKK